MTDLRTAAQQALEALTSRDGDGWTRRFARDRAIEALHAALAEPVQEPVAYSVGRTLHWHEGKGVSDAQLFAAPPQRKPLTEEELDELAMDEDGLPNSHLEFARAVALLLDLTEVRLNEPFPHLVQYYERVLEGAIRHPAVGPVKYLSVKVAP